MTRLLLALALALLGCRSRPLQLTLIDASVQRPSNIAVYFTVETADGAPVAGLTADSFRIYEDGQPVSVLESKQNLLNAEVATTHYTLLLIDMSGSVAESGDVPVIVEAANAFAGRVAQFQKVGIYAFDGSPTIMPVTAFGSGGNANALTTFKARDPSTNLNGAVIEGIKILQHQMAASPTPLTFGTLVVFTDGTDRAQRVPRDKLHAALDKLELDVIVVGVGAEIDTNELETIGRDGAILSKDRAQIAQSFAAAAAKVEAYSKRYYLLGYCSPARAGEHVLRIETAAAGATGYYEHKFNAAGFGPNCDPKRPPAFNIKRPKRVVLAR